MFKESEKKLSPYLVILAIGLLLYGRTIFFDFTYLDDNALILDNFSLLSDVRNIGTIFGSDVFLSADKFYYRPLLNLSFMADAAVAGAQPVIFHLTNILLHILAAVLVFGLLGKLGKGRPLAMFLTLLFLVHPVLTQAVAWIPGRNDSLLAVFILAAWILFLNFSERPRLWNYLGYLSFFFLALLTKESAVFLPPLIIFYFLAIQPARVSRPDRWLLVIGSGAIIFFWLIMRRLALGPGTTDYGAAISGMITNSQALLIYIGKLILPFDLGVFPILADSTLIYGIISAVLLVAALWFSPQRRNSHIIFGVSWFLLFLLPSFIRPSGLLDFLEHRVYLSFIGFLIILAEIGWLDRADWKRFRVRLLATIVLTLLAALSFYQSAKFQDRLSFWEAAVAGSPHSPLAQRNLGVMYYFQGDREKAIERYRLALELEPAEPMVHNNLGVIYLAEEKLDEAEAEFRRELEVNPSYDRALFNLGEVYLRRKQLTEALYFWQATLAANPGHYEAQQRLLIWQKKIQ